MTSPVERISGPGSGSTPGNRSNGKTGSLTAISVGTPSWTPRSSRLAPAQTLAASSAHGVPLARARNGTVREARGLTSMTKTVFSWIANWTLMRPRTSERQGEQTHLPPQLRLQLERQADRRRHRGRVARVDPRLFDVFEDAADDDPLAVGDCVDVDLDRALEEVVEQDRAVRVDGGRLPEVLLELVVTVDDLHGPPAENVGGPHEHREAELIGRSGRLVGRGHHPPGRLPQTELGEQFGETAAVLGAVDGVARGAANGTPCRSRSAASLSGVWPPSWTMTPIGRSASQMSRTSSKCRGSK